MIALCVFYIYESDASAYTCKHYTSYYFVNGWYIGFDEDPATSYEVDDGTDDVYHLQVTTSIYFGS